MSPAEVGARTRHHIRHLTWKTRQVRPGATLDLSLPRGCRTLTCPLPPDAASAVPVGARDAVLEAARGILRGSGRMLGVARCDLAAPDWFFDPVTGRRAPQDQYAFTINHRSQEVCGNVKQVWELSRHHHLTTLAAAWFLSGDERYAQMVARQLTDWWQQNPYLSGVHWTSGIELGIRLISWTWIRRLLDGWEGVGALFEENALALSQLRWHHEYLAAFRSVGSSANNHVIAEAAGQVVAASALPWFEESRRWRSTGLEVLETELHRNTFPSGVNRELASDYHPFVAELGLLAAVEAGIAGHSVSDDTSALLCRMVDAAAAMVDVALRGPRQGDGDDGQALVVDGPAANRWPGMLLAGAALFGPLSWWPALPPSDVRSTLLARLAALADLRLTGGERPSRRSSHFPDAGLTLLRTAQDEGPEIWCRCDGGPHGYLSIAAHAHADALSIEVRHAGIDVFADPGTYCYHVEPEWRAYFRSTLAHNTLEVAGTDQSSPGGPFLWLTQAKTEVRSVTVDAGDGTERWSAQHDGYARLDPPAVHNRTVRLDRGRRRLEVVDRIESEGPSSCQLAFHLGPSVRAVLDGSFAQLKWPSSDGVMSATIVLPSALRWVLHRGETDPILGWYSPHFGVKQPAYVILGAGRWEPGDEFVTIIEFASLP